MGGALRATHRFFMPINVRGMTMTDYRRTRLQGEWEADSDLTLVNKVHLLVE